jgi:hypothetical protein
MSGRRIVQMLSTLGNAEPTMTKDKSGPLPAVYDSFLQELKDRIRSAQVRAVLSVNREPVVLYWTIGRDILNRQQDEGWGTKIIDRLSDDLNEGISRHARLSGQKLEIHASVR